MSLYGQCGSPAAPGQRTLTLRPRANLTRYHGLFAPNCRLRPRVVPSPRGATRKRRHCTRRKEDADATSAPQAPAVNDDGLPIAPMNWAERLRRVFLIDITTCPRCGGRLRWIADVIDPDVIRTILRHLGAARRWLDAPPSATKFVIY